MVEVAKQDRVLPVSLAFIAGFVDTCGFVALFGLFSAHVTGNFVLLGASMVQPHPGALAKLLALPIFILAVAGTRLCLIGRAATRDAVRGVLAAELLFLCLFLAAGILATPIVDADAPRTILVGMLAVVAMGVQNAASRTVFVTLSPTTVMTGNVTQVVLDCVDFIASRNEDIKQATRARIIKFAPPVLAFALGAAGGALGIRQVGFWCLMIPILVIGALLVRRGSPKTI